MRILLVFAIAASVLWPQGSAGQPPPTGSRATTVRPAASSPATGGILHGRVTVAGGNQPLRRVRITLNTPASNLPATVTDSQGLFELTDVPPGTYTLTASRAGYLKRQYGQHRPHEAGRRVAIVAGQVVDGLDIALPRSAVLAGRLSDEGGEPLQGARVEAVELRYIRGQRVAVSALVTRTNDQGDYRLSGLENGAYQIRASSTDVWEGDDGRSTSAFAMTYYPGVLAGDRPQSLKVPTGGQLEALDFRLVASNAARISGTVYDTNGEPLVEHVVWLGTITRTVGGALLSSGTDGRTKTDAKGGFEFSKLAPGEYQVMAGGPNDHTTVKVVVDQGDVKRVALVPHRPTAASGSIVSDDGKLLPFPPTRLRIDAISADPANVLPDWGSTDPPTPKSDGTFQVPNLDGPYLFRVTGLPDEWMLMGVLLRGRDVTDTPVRIVSGGKDIDGLQMVLSRNGAKITGDVADRDGRAAPDVTVIVFAENRALWGVASRYVRGVRPDQRGKFSVVGLPAGRYRLVACEEVADGQWEDPDFLDSLLNGSAKVELAGAASKTITLTVDIAR